ncbi:MAG TPA: hypothetical protein VN654_08975 [Vicinamibacterales bacterium]|jgi:hypothetical protein|nr:hypothetical protein [Vicinamibacterales bacterium]
MTEQELRQIVRDAIARTRGRSANPVNPLNPDAHASHAMFLVASGADQEGPCIIEPAVPCTHCGYCKSLGH